MSAPFYCVTPLLLLLLLLLRQGDAVAGAVGSSSVRPPVFARPGPFGFAQGRLPARSSHQKTQIYDL
jgi:hypothetical protein